MSRSLGPLRLRIGDLARLNELVIASQDPACAVHRLLIVA
jgi:hypothetical protein